MKKMNETMSTIFGRLGLRHLQNEQGLMLVLTLVILLVLSTLASTNIINAYLDRSLTRNQHYASISLNAADAGLDYGLTWLNENSGSIPCTDPADVTCTSPYKDADYCYKAGNPQQAFQTLTGSLTGGGNYVFNLRFKCEDVFYADGDVTSSTLPEIVYYNNCASTIDDCWGFQDAIFNTAGDGEPVIEIEAVGDFQSAGSRRVTLNVARKDFNIKAYGAVTAASSVNTSGNINIDGNAHDENGNPCAGQCTCGNAYPGITTDVGAVADCTGGSSSCGGTNPGSESTIDLVDPPGPDPAGSLSVPTSPDDALGLPVGTLAGSTMFNGTPASGATLVDGNITWVNDNYDWSLSGTTTGIIIVSNPLFDAERWRVSVPTVPNPAGGAQIANPDLNALHGKYNAALNADYDSTKAPHLQNTGVAELWRPRNINQQGNGTHKGVVIADSIDKINGNCTIIGSMISLSTMSVNTLGNGAANIIYSCDAILLNTNQGYSEKLAWRRHY